MTSTLLSVVTIIISFVAQRVFVQCLNTEYLGINGLFTNIISMLSVVELGLGSAVVYHLYKPLSTKDTPKIKSLMEFYKKGYRLIALIVFVFGLLVIPFLGRLVGNTHAVHENITYIYLFFLADVVFSYLLAYKRSILYGDQKNFIISLVHVGYVVIMNGLQIATLILTRNFYIYLGIKLAIRVLENVVLNVIVNRQYPFLLGVPAEELDPETKKDIFIKIKALFLHKTGTFAVLVKAKGDRKVLGQAYNTCIVGIKKTSRSVVFNSRLPLRHRAGACCALINPAPLVFFALNCKQQTRVVGK